MKRIKPEYIAMYLEKDRVMACRQSITSWEESRKELVTVEYKSDYMVGYWGHRKGRRRAQWNAWRDYGGFRKGGEESKNIFR